MLWIAGGQVKAPSDIKVSRYDLSKSRRNAAGDMVMDIIATKRTVEATWKYILDTDLQRILSLIESHKPFFTLRYPDVGGTREMICYAGDRHMGLWYTIGGVRRWEQFSVTFIER